MHHIITALIPIFSLILIGYFFKKISFPSTDFWPNADKLTYYILMPSLLVYKLSNASLEALKDVNFILAGLGGILVLTFILLLIQRSTKIDGASFTSITQGAIRFNTYVFLALASSLFGDEGLIISVLLITFVIPLINVVCIVFFSLFTNKTQLSFISLIKSIFSNPLIIACLLGGSINFIGLNIPISVEKVFYILSLAALPMGLLSVGVGFELSGFRDLKMSILVSSASKLILLPIIMYVIGIMIGLNSLSLSILLIFSAMPTAPSAYILARQLGGNTKLMSSIITLQTFLSIFTIAIIIKFLEYMNYL